MWYHKQHGRFIVKRQSEVCYILVDKETGVNYLFLTFGPEGASGLTVMVDADGKPIVTPITE